MVIRPQTQYVAEVSLKFPNPFTSYHLTTCMIFAYYFTVSYTYNMYLDCIPHYPLSHPLFITCIKTFKVHLFICVGQDACHSVCAESGSLLPCGP